VELHKHELPLDGPLKAGDPLTFSGALECLDIDRIAGGIVVAFKRAGVLVAASGARGRCPASGEPVE